MIPFQKKRFCYDILAYFITPMANPGHRPPEFLFELDDCPLQAPRCVRKVALLKVLEVFFGDFPKWDAISKWQIAWRCVSLLERWHFEIQRLAKQHTIGWRALCNHSLLRWSIAFVLSFSLDSFWIVGSKITKIVHKYSSQKFPATQRGVQVLCTIDKNILLRWLSLSFEILWIIYKPFDTHVRRDHHHLMKGKAIILVTGTDGPSPVVLAPRVFGTSKVILYLWPASYEWNCSRYKWPYKWVTGV